MDIKKYLNTHNKNASLIHQYAFLGKGDLFEERLQELSNLAESENWTSSNSPYPYDILQSYIYHTFDTAARDNLVLITEDEEYSCFNTGLLTDNGEDILCLFNKFVNSKKFHWHLMGFRKKSDWDFLKIFSETPQVVSYFTDPSKIYFNPNVPIIKNLDHILDDNIERFPTELRSAGKQQLHANLSYALDLTLKRCQRNYRIAVPQMYMNKITYLLPVNLNGTMMSVAVEEVNKRYRVNTIFTLEMAYKNARLLMKPEADWLTLATKKEAE